jgi:NTP pyrophosphatase (non-canonical NTP hydrolase)
MSSTNARRHAVLQLTELQIERDKWIAHNFPNDEPVDSVLGAVEELGELAHAFLKHKQGIRGDAADLEAEMADAVADCVIYLAGVCSHLDLDFGVLVDNTWHQVKQRDWVAYPENGVDS